MAPIFQACLENDVRLIDTRHEAAAGHAADAYARQTGGCAVAMATAGPGYTNVITAITQAHLDCSPVLFLIGAAPLRDAERWPLQGGIDQVAMAKPVTRWAAQVTRTELIPHMVAHAIRETTNGQPGPVLLEIPIDVLFDRVSEDSAPIPDTITPDTAPAPSATKVGQALEMLKSAERPAIICGGGMLFSKGAAEALRTFAAAAGIPVYSNNKARGMIAATDPLYAGPLTNMMVASATGIGTPDVVLTLGARFGMFTEPGMLGPARIPPDDCKIIQVDVSKSEMGRIRKVHLPVQADCGEMLNALIAASQETEWPDWRGWSEAINHLTTWHTHAYDKAIQKSTLMHPYEAVREIMKALDDDTIICADGGEASGWVDMLTQAKDPAQFMTHGYLGCLGIGMPFAMGAKVAHPDKPVAVIIGDGSVGFHIQEFDTMVRHDLPIVTIVLNNKAWGMCVHGQQAMFGENRLVVTTLGDAHYEKVAEGFGAQGEYIDDPRKIVPAIRRAFASGLPACINIITDLDAVLGDTEGEKISKMEGADGEISMPYYDSLKKDEPATN
ncbi:MAG: thiamine pyrophosphate-binding protein [Pseudomonadales bacterium]|nr:thiamine pyrophosphate-binding protein [Pseudomonadales bacterium]